MKLSKVKSVKQLGRWYQAHGLTPGENRDFGTVHAVHTAGSMHYRLGIKSNLRTDLQGNLAIDLNDRGVADNWFFRLKRGHWKLWKPQSETEALRAAYVRVLRVARKKSWPLEEQFFDGLGFIIESGHGVNHPISGHDNHLHVAFWKSTF